MATGKTALHEVPRSWAPTVEIRTADLAQAGGGVTEIAINEDGGDLDFRIEGDANTNLFNTDAGLFSGKGAVGVGGAATNKAVLLIDNAVFTAVANTNIAKVKVENTNAITVPTGTTAIAASLHVDEPNLTATGTITDAATIYVEAAPTEGGTGNWALWVDAGVTRLDGTAYIGDTSNADVTLGLTLNQGAADDGILALKSSDVTHGVTTIAETDSFGDVRKYSATEGGLLITGLSEGEEGVTLRGIGTAAAGDPPTTSTTANINLNAAIINGTGLTAAAATNPILNVQNNGTNEFVVMGDGELYSNQSATVGTFDTYEDAVMCWDLAHLLANQTEAIFRYQRDTFIQAGILTEGGMLSLTKLNQLLLCSQGQLHQQLQALRAEVAALKALPA